MRASAGLASLPTRWPRQHVSASERLSRNHLVAEKQTRPQLPRHSRHGFDTDCSYVAVQPGQHPMNKP